MPSIFSLSLVGLILAAGLGLFGDPALAQRGEGRDRSRSADGGRFESRRGPESLVQPNDQQERFKIEQNRIERAERFTQNDLPKPQKEMVKPRSMDGPPAGEFRGGRGEDQPDFVRRPPRAGFEGQPIREIAPDFSKGHRSWEKAREPNPRIRTWDSLESLQGEGNKPNNPEAAVSKPVSRDFPRETQKDEFRRIEDRPRLIEIDRENIRPPAIADDRLTKYEAAPSQVESKTRKADIRKPSIVRGQPEEIQEQAGLEKGQREVDSQPNLPRLGELEGDRIRPSKPATVIRTDSIPRFPDEGQSALSDTKNRAKPEVRTYEPRLDGLTHFSSSDVRKMNAAPVLIRDKRHDRVLDVRNWLQDNEKIAWRGDSSDGSNDSRGRRNDGDDRRGDRDRDRDRDWDRHHDHWRHHWDYRRDRHRYHDAIININIRNYYGAPFAYFPAYYYVTPPVPFAVYRSLYYFDLGIVTGPGYYYAPLLPAYGYRYGHRIRYSTTVAYRIYSCSPYVYREYVTYPWYSTFYYSTHDDWRRAVAYAPGFASGLYFASDGDDYLIRFSFGYGGGIRWGEAPFVYSWYPYGGYDRIEVTDAGGYEEYVAPDSYYNEYEIQ